jgi:hypothetical protein
MTNNRSLSMLITWMKFATLFMGLYCIAAMFFLGFDPWHSLDGLIFRDLGIDGELTPETRSVFRFVFLLFNLLSVVCALLQYFLVTRGLAKGEVWAGNALLAGMLIWVLGAIAVALATKVYIYLVSVAMMAFLFLLPLALIRLLMSKGKIPG